jgi:hypothetical protein
MVRFVIAQNILRYRNLLQTLVDETERQTIQNLLDEEEAKQALHALAPSWGGETSHRELWSQDRRVEGLGTLG